MHYFHIIEMWQNIQGFNAHNTNKFKWICFKGNQYSRFCEYPLSVGISNLDVLKWQTSQTTNQYLIRLEFLADVITLILVIV